MDLLVVIGVVIAAIVVLVLVLKALWRVAEPNEALIISGFRARSSPGDAADSLGFKIVTGKGTLVIPGFQAARRLSLDTRGANLQVSCVTKQGIPVAVRGVVIYKVGDDYVSIANAARRFLDQQNTINETIHELFAGHLRSICGGLTIEDMIHNREALTGEVRRSSADEMSKLGLVIDSLQIQEIDDASGYILNLGKPFAAAIASAARIAEAQRDQEATEAEQAADAKKAAAVRASRIQQAGYQAEIDEASAKATQAGPLSQATARQEVVVQETRAAQLEADLAEQRLQSQVRRPADAKAYELRTLAEAQRDARIAGANAEATATRVSGEAEADATKARGLADADAARAKGLAEAAAMQARSDALAQNQEGVIAQQLAENWPEIVRAGASALGNVDHMVVLNGADGVADLLAQAMAMGGTGLGLARTLLGAVGGSPTPAPAGSTPRPARADPATGNGTAPAPEDVSPS